MYIKYITWRRIVDPHVASTNANRQRRGMRIYAKNDTYTPIIRLVHPVSVEPGVRISRTARKHGKPLAGDGSNAVVGAPVVLGCKNVARRIEYQNVTRYIN